MNNSNPQNESETNMPEGGDPDSNGGEGANRPASQSADRDPASRSQAGQGNNVEEVNVGKLNVNEIHVNQVNVSNEKSFEELSEESQVGLIQEFVDFLRYNKKWWLTPIIAVLLLVGVLIFLTTSGAAPFLYTFW